MKTIKKPKTLNELIELIDENIEFLKHNQKLDWGYLGSRNIKKDEVESLGIEILRIRRNSGIIQAKVPLELIASQWMPPNAPGHLDQLKEEIDEILDSNLIVSTLWRDPKNGKLYVVDGGHRFDVSYSLGIPYLVCNVFIEKDKEWYKNYRAKESLARADIGEFRVAAQYIKEWDKSYHAVFNPLDVISCIKSIKKDKFHNLSRLASEVRSSNHAEYACNFMQQWMDESHISLQTAERYFRAYSIIAGENENLIGKANISTALILEADSRLRAVEHDYELSNEALDYYIKNYDKILGWVLETSAKNSTKNNKLLSSIIKAVGTSLKKNVPLDFEEKKDGTNKKTKKHTVKVKKNTQSIETLLNSSPSSEAAIENVKRVNSSTRIKKHMLPIPLDELVVTESIYGDILTPGQYYAIVEGNAILFSTEYRKGTPVSLALGSGVFKISQGYYGKITSQKARISKIMPNEWRTGSSGIINHRMIALEKQASNDVEYRKVLNQKKPIARVLGLIRMYQGCNDPDMPVNLSTKEISVYCGIDTSSALAIMGFLHKEKIITINDSFSFSVLPKFKSVSESFENVPGISKLNLAYFLDHEYLVQNGEHSHLALLRDQKHVCDTYRIPLPTCFVPWENLDACTYCTKDILGGDKKVMPVDYLLSKARSLRIEIDEATAMKLMEDATFLSFNGKLIREKVSFSVYNDSRKKIGILKPVFPTGSEGSCSAYKGHFLVRK